MSSIMHATPVALADLSPLERQRLFALRFRTEYCRTWLCTGECRYRDKCMFAHGEEELRTEAQNDADHLTSDKAVRMWIRDRRRAAYALAQAAKCEEEGAAATAEAKEVIAQPATPTESFLDSHEHASDDSSDEHDSSCSCRHAGLPPSAAIPQDRVVVSAQPSKTTHNATPALGAVVFQYRYNPYSIIRVKVTLRRTAAVASV